MPKDKAPYHHGDLRTALLTAGEVVLSESGVEGFSLRRVAREVGVSHAAPAHHFGDTQGLLDALAAEGFRRFLGAMHDRQAALTSKSPRDMLMASGLGYLDFAIASPALFRLMFGNPVRETSSLELQKASQASFEHLTTDVQRIRGDAPMASASGMADVMASWSMVHGFTELLVSGKMKPIQTMDRAAQERFFQNIFERVIPMPAD